MPKILYGIFLFVLPVLFLYPQNVEKITYMDLGPDGSQRINMTVNAVFAGWEQMEIRQEGNLRAVYQWFCPVNGEWSARELMEKRPMQGTLNQQYDALLRDYTIFPNAGSVSQLGKGINGLRMLDIPERQSKPMWWSTDGNSFFVFYKVYLIIK